MEKLIGDNGQPHFGQFDPAPADINYRDCDLRSPMDRRRGRLARHFAFNQFQFVALSSPELIVGLAIVDLKWLSNAFVYAYSPLSGAFEEFSFLQPLARRTGIETRPNDGEAVFHKGSNRLHISAERGLRRVSVSLASGLCIEADIDEGDAYAPMALCTRAGYQGWVYTQKITARPVKGTVHWQGTDHDLAAQRSLGSVDWTAGYMRRETFWNWGSLSAYLPDGRRLGFNLVAGVNDTGYTENALWLDDQLIKLSTVVFEFDRDHRESRWRMRSQDGVLDLSFEPAGRRSERRDAGFIASNFSQFFGRYTGTVRLPGETLHVDGLWGLAEDHYARW